MSDAYLVEETDYYRITDPSGVGITYRVIAKADNRVVGEVVSLPAARKLAESINQQAEMSGED